MTGKQLKNSILQWAIQGKLVPQDPNDEPASVLLEKIRQEKERLIKEKKIKRDKNASIIFRGEDNSYYEKFLATGEVKCIDEEIPFEIPQGWEWCRLSNIGITETGTTPSKTHPEYFGDYMPFLGPANILDDKIISETQGLSEEGIKYGRVIPANSILQVCIGGSIGKCAIVRKEVTFNQQINSITPIKCCLKYVHYVLQSETFRLSIMTKATGTATPIINRGNWEMLLFPLPPYNEQNRIVEKLDSLKIKLQHYSNTQINLQELNNNLHLKLKKSILQEAIQGKLVPQIAKEGTARELLEQIRQEKQKLVEEGKLKQTALTDSIIYKGDDNRYYEKIGQQCKDITEEIPFEIPENWEWTRMGQIGDWGAGSTPQRGNAMYYNGNIPWLKTGELNNGIVYDTEEKVTQKAFQDCSLRMNKIGDVLIAMYGATIGKLAIVGKELTTNQACCGCTPYMIYNWYLFYFLMASKDAFIKKGEGGAQPNISRVKLVEHLIPLPPLKEQQRIVAQIERLFEQLK